jgi:hypothetical protein
MKSWSMLGFLAAACLSGAAARADSLRCGSRLVSEEDTREQVLAKCGEAAEVQHSSVWRVPLVWIGGRRIRAGNDLIEVPVELWIYNFGPHKFMRRVRFEDGLVVDVETLGYGYIKD